MYLGGTGTISGKGKFIGAEALKLEITGNGDIVLDVNTPKIVAEIAGVGNLFLAGETAVAEFEIAGTGECNALNLKAETSKVNIVGNGTVNVFAASLLSVNIVGNGNVYYKGSPVLKQKIVGVGTVKRSDERSE